MRKQRFAALSTSLVLLASLLTAGTALAQGPQAWHRDNDGRMGHIPGVFGTVTGVSGDTITIDSKMMGPSGSQTTYTVDASGATVYKGGSTSTVGDIAQGDSIMVDGSISGTNVTATTIRDGVPFGVRGDGDGPDERPFGNAIQGNGQPVIGGTIATINGSTLTVTNKSNVTYTVDASGAKIVKKNATSSVSDLAVGDSVLVQGTTNGTDVSAYSVIDQGTPHTPPANANSNSNNSGNATYPGFFHGFFGRIGGLFHRLFGFF